jgi:hypothetical protein
MESKTSGPLCTPRAKEKRQLPGADFDSYIRNMYLTLCADAGNPTKRWSALSLLPFFLIFENLPETMRNLKQNIFLFCLVPGPKHAKHLLPYLREFVDEMNVLTTDGFQCFDVYRQQMFLLRAMVLRVIGDYPGIAQLLDLANHTSKAGCIKCTQFGERQHSTMCHQLETKDAKSHRWFVEKFSEIELLRDDEAGLADIVKTTGVNGKSYLTRLLYFDMEKDSILDLPHTAKRIFFHQARLVKGRKAKLKSMEAKDAEKARQDSDAKEASDDPIFDDSEDIEMKGEVEETEVQKMKSWAIPIRQQTEADLALTHIIAPTKYYINGKAPLSRGGQMKMNDVQHWFTNYGRFHIWSMNLEPKHAALLNDLRDVVQSLYEWEFNPSDAKLSMEEVDEIEDAVKSVLVRWKKETPVTSRAIVFHLLLHFPAQMRRWGSLRWCWMYPYERFIGALFDFIHGRQSMALELVNKYGRSLQARVLTDKAFVNISISRGGVDPRWNRLLKTRQQVRSRRTKLNQEKRFSQPTLTEKQRKTPRGDNVNSQSVPPLADFFVEHPEFESTDRHQILKITGHALSLRGRRMGTCGNFANNSCLRIRFHTGEVNYIQAHQWYHVRLFKANHTIQQDLVFCNYHTLNEGMLIILSYHASTVFGFRWTTVVHIFTGDAESVNNWPRLVDYVSTCDEKDEQWCEASAIDAIAVLVVKMTAFFQTVSVISNNV